MSSGNFSLDDWALSKLYPDPFAFRPSELAFGIYGKEPDEFLTISDTPHQNLSYKRTFGAVLPYRDWLDLMAAHGGLCLYCGEAGRLQVDHIVPVSRGGGNEASNLAPACKPCNFDKRANRLSVWLPRRPDLSPRDIAGRWARAGREGELPL